MKIFECNFETANGDIHHQVYVDWDDTGNLKFAEIDEGEGVQNAGTEIVMNTFLLLMQRICLSSFICSEEGF